MRKQFPKLFPGIIREVVKTRVLLFINFSKTNKKDAEKPKNIFEIYDSLG